MKKRAKRRRHDPLERLLRSVARQLSKPEPLDRDKNPQWRRMSTSPPEGVG